MLQRRFTGMFFLAAPPDERYKVIQKFYRYRVGLIERFYGNRLRLLDRVRILAEYHWFRSSRFELFLQQELPIVLAKRELSEQGV